MKKILMLAALLCLITLGHTSSVYANGEQLNLKEASLWRIDTKNEAHLPRNFRTTDDEFKVVKGEAPSRQGLENLHESGSAQFSKLEFEALMSKLPKKVVIVDLRQETHGLLNGIGVSWYGERNWGNLGKARSEIEKSEKQRLKNTLGTKVIISALDEKKEAGESQEITVETALTEEELVKAYGAGYFRITATDHITPNDESVDRFIEFYRTLPNDVWLHFHCQAGQGRTTSFMVIGSYIRPPSITR